MHFQIALAFFTYFCILLSIGLIAHKKQTSEAEFIMGNRSLNFWLTALSAHASDMSAWLFMAFPAAIFAGGLSQSWTAVGLVVGMFCNWQFVAKKLRTQTEAFNSYTLSTFFENKYKDSSGVLRITTALMTVFFLTTYLSAGLIAMGMLFESIFGIDYYIGLSVAVFVGVTYTFFGGFVTVAWTDLFQAVFLLIVILLVPIVAFFQVPNGFEGIASIAKTQNKSMSFIVDFSPQSFSTIILLMLSWGLGYFGQPHILTKFMGIKSVQDLTKSKYLGMTWQILALTAAGAVGVIGIGYFSGGGQDPQLVFVDMVKGLFSPYMAGLILCAVIAANMSTMDSQILVSASVLSEDLYKHLLKKKASSKNLLAASRISVVGISLLALALAFNKSQTILEVVLYAWSGLGASFGPLVLMSLYYKNTSKYGAIAGILTGGVLAATWSVINPYVIDFPVPAMIPAFFLSLLSIYIVSKIKQPDLR